MNMINNRALTLAAALGIGLIGAALASLPANADVPRYQIITLNYSAVNYYLEDSQPVGTGYPQSLILTLNPCDGTFTGTGVANPGALTPSTTVGSIESGLISYVTSYPVGTQTDYEVTVDDAVLSPNYSFTGFWEDNYNLGAQDGIVVSGIPQVTSTTYKNHGAFVSANPDKNDAAHSCIGLPIQSNK